MPLIGCNYNKPLQPESRQRGDLAEEDAFNDERSPDKAVVRRSFHDAISSSPVKVASLMVVERDKHRHGGQKSHETQRRRARMLRTCASLFTASRES
jgi:hypothetical protein